MKSKWIWTTLGAVPFLAAVVTLQSCGGEGGPIGGDGGGGGPSISQAFLDLQSAEQRAASAVGSDRCSDGACHGSGAGSQHETWLLTKHGQEGVGCERCHGNGGAHAAGPNKTNILTFPRVVAPVVCGQCHGPLYEEFENSSHAHIVEHPVADGAINPNQYGRTSRCMTCHSGLYKIMTDESGIDPVDMTDAQIAQIATWASDPQQHVEQSATCATCHDPHAKTGKLNDEGEELQLRRNVYNTSTTDIGPGQPASVFTKFDHLCGQCHNGRGVNPSDTALTSSTSRPSMHDSNQFNTLMGIGGAEGPGGPPFRNMSHAFAPGQCSHCHMPDSRHTFTVSYDKGCAPCHTAADAAARQTALVEEFTSALIALRTRMTNWAIATYPDGHASGEYDAADMDPRLRPFLWEYNSNITAAATEFGIDTTVATNMPPSTHQGSIPIQVKRARHNYYFVVRDSSICPHNPPYARYLLQWANENMDAVGAPRADGRAMNLSLKQMKQILEADRLRASKAELEAPRDDD